MLRLICALDDDQTMSDAQVAALLAAGSRRTTDEYRRFLESGELISGTREIGGVLDLSDVGRGKSTYRILGEITLLCAGLYPTPARPDAAAFASTAIHRFLELDRGEGLVLTGAWLESLIQNDGIHPEVARRRLDEASERGLLRRITEGSTTQVRFRDRVVHVLRLHAGQPIAMPVHLYQGDYLIPGKGSVSLRIEGSTP